MTRRSVLNITTRKKCDNMTPRVVNPDGTTTLTPYSSPDALMCLFVPTARASRLSLTDPSVRNLTETFAVGYREKVQIDVQGGGTVMWRRIVFMLKGGDLRTAMDTGNDGNIPNQLFWQITSGGCNRVIGPLDPAHNSQQELVSFVFKGQEDVDWVNYFTAPVDTSRVRVKSDRTRVIRPGNETGASRSYRCWYPIRRSLVYNDDMESNVVGDKVWSTPGLRGVGDMYVMDIMGFTAGTGTYRFTPEGSYYWHER